MGDMNIKQPPYQGECDVYLESQRIGLVAYDVPSWRRQQFPPDHETKGIVLVIETHDPTNWYMAPGYYSLRFDDGGEQTFVVVDPSTGPTRPNKVYKIRLSGAYRPGSLASCLTR